MRFVWKSIRDPKNKQPRLKSVDLFNALRVSNLFGLIIEQRSFKNFQFLPPFICVKIRKFSVPLTINFDYNEWVIDLPEKFE